MTEVRDAVRGPEGAPGGPGPVAEEGGEDGAGAGGPALEEELRTALTHLDRVARRASAAGLELTVELAGPEGVVQSVAWNRVKGVVLYDFDP